MQCGVVIFSLNETTFVCISTYTCNNDLVKSCGNFDTYDYVELYLRLPELANFRSHTMFYLANLKVADILAFLRASKWANEIVLVAASVNHYHQVQ